MSIGWPVPSLAALVAVVEAISNNSTVVRLDIGDRGMNQVSFDNMRNMTYWWNGKEEKIKELLSYALTKNTSIKKIHLKECTSPCIFHFVDLAKHC